MDIKLQDQRLSVAIDLSDSDQKLQKGLKILYFKGKGTTYKKYSDFTLNEKVLSDFVENFKSKVTKQDIFLNFNHDIFGKAAGWIKDIYLSDSKKELLMDVELTDAGQEAIEKKEYRYLSGEFTLGQWRNSETGKVYENVFTGAALTNIPFLRGTEITKLYQHWSPVTSESSHESAENLSASPASENGGCPKDINNPTVLTNSEKGGTMGKSELLAQLADEYEINVIELQNDIKLKDEKISSLDTQLSDLRADKESIEEQLSTLKAETLEKEKEALFKHFLNTGQLVKSQKGLFEAVVESKGVDGAKVELEKLPKQIDLSVIGSGEDSTETVLDENASDSEKLNLKVEFELKKNKELTYEQALNKVIQGDR